RRGPRASLGSAARRRAAARGRGNRPGARRARHREPPGDAGHRITVSAPLLPLALAFTWGVALGLCVEPPLWLAPAGMGLVVLLLVTGRGRSIVGASAGVVVLCALAGWARGALPDPFPALRGIDPGPVILEGLVAGSPESEGPRTRFPLMLLRVG